MTIQNGTFLITGGASLVGSHITEQLLEQGVKKVILFDNYSLGTPEAVAEMVRDPRVELVRGDILRTGELYDRLAGVDGVFAVAGFLTLPLSQNPQLGLAVNVEGQINVLEACRYRGVKRVVFSSSIATYGEPGDGLVDEDTPFSWQGMSAASGLYGASKLIGENLMRLYAQRHGIGTVSLRYSSVYGERQHYRGVNALYIIETYDRILKGERPVIPDDGREVHDYVHAADVARANIMCMASDVSGESFNVCTGTATTLNRLVEIVLEVTGSDLKPDYRNEPGKVRATTSTALNLSREKIRRMVGWEPQVSLEEGIRRVIRWRESLDH